MRSNLPAGWKWGKVADIYNAVKTKVDPTSSDKASYIGLEHLSKGGGIESIGSSESLQSIKTVFEAGDVLYGKLRPYLNKHAVVDFEGVCSTDILAFRPKNEYSGQLLNYFLGLPSVIQHANENSKGINLPRVNAETLLEMEMPIPPVEEAKRIIAQLEAIMQKLEASQERLEKLPVLLKKFREAVLAAAVSGKLTDAWREEQPRSETASELLNHIRAERRSQWEEKQFAKMKGKQLPLTDSWKQKYEEPAAPDTSELPELPEGWGYVSLLDISTRITDGTHQPPKFVEAGIPFIFVKHIMGGAIDFSDTRFISLEEYEQLTARCPIEVGDVLYSAVGSYGKAVPVDTEEPFTFQRHIAHIKLTKSVLTRYMVFYLNSILGVTQSHRVARGVAQKTVTLGELSKFVIGVPPLAEQQEIVRQVSHYFDLADQLEVRFEQAAALVEQLPQALLSKAFSGQLVPQDPNDEPASALLERLHAPATAPAKEQRGRKPKGALATPLFN